MQFDHIVSQINQLHGFSAIRDWLHAAFTSEMDAASAQNGVAIVYFLDTNSSGEKEIIAELQHINDDSWTLILHSKMEEQVEMVVLGHEMMTEADLQTFVASQMEGTE